MKDVIAIAACFVILLCAGLVSRSVHEQRCLAAWADSGYRVRYDGGVCQVQLRSARWVPAAMVREVEAK